MSRRAAVISLFVAVLLGAAMAWAGSRGGAVVASGVPLFALCVAAAFLIQWGAFLPAYVLQTEIFYDLVGSLTYLSVTLLALGLTPEPGLRAYALGAMIAVWAVRLGSFLFRRAMEAGGDSRFDDIKPSFVRFLNTWTLQGLWVTVTASAALAAITSEGSADPSDLGILAAVGIALWVLGFGFEVVADRQKRRFRADPENEGEFIRSGLWSLSRHPNYFGEIVLWTGVALAALPALDGWQHATLISPVFVYLLLTRVSGIPMLEAKADERWGDRESYQAYKRETPVLWPRIGSAGRRGSEDRAG